MNQHLLDACESVDAAVFNGDVIWDDNSRTQLKEYVERWQRAIAEHERTEADAAEQAASGNAAFSEAVAASLGIPTGYVFEVADDCMDQEQQA